VEQQAVHSYLDHTDDGANNDRGDHDRKCGLGVEMNGHLCIQMAVDDRRDHDGANNDRGDHDRKCGLGVEMNGHLCMRMAVDDHRDHDGANNVR
jgi:hypothetical protein